MKPYSEICHLSEMAFKRTTGLSKLQFANLLKRVEIFLSEAKTRNPMKRRGQKGQMSLADKLLLTVYYLRHYPTFDSLRQVFGISESYANKLYHYFSHILLKVLSLTSRKHLLEANLEALLMDVSEQPIERPQHKQRAYYSGKKNGTRSKLSF